MPKAKTDSAENPNLESLRKRIAKAPQDAGVYRWKDADGTILYVGKAKNLRNRLKQYVTGPASAHGPWKQSFLRKVADFEITVTGSELEALILETNMIKENRPKYNVLMKDDKNYVYARVTINETYPRVESVRFLNLKDGALYFGPILSNSDLWETLTAIRTVFPFRTCKMDIQTVSGEKMNDELREMKDENIHHSSLISHHSPDKKIIPIDVVCSHRDRPTPCLDHHIGKCGAPCVGLVTPEEYKRDVIDGVIRFLKGDYDSVKNILTVRMQQAAAEKKFELAGKLRDQMTAMDRLQGKQIISDTTGEDADVIAIAIKSGHAHVCVLRRRDGRIIGDEEVALMGVAEEPEVTLGEFLAQFYADREIPQQIILSHEPPDMAVLGQWLSEKRGTKVQMLLPERGTKSKLLQMAEKNALEKARTSELKWEAEERNTKGAVRELAEKILPNFTTAEHGDASKTPLHRIECYDISHMGGNETVASMTVALDGKLDSSHYRSFNMRTVKEGDIDDYRSLREALLRRLRRLHDDLPEEEKRWNAKGVTFGKALKKDAEFIANVVADSPGDIGSDGLEDSVFWLAKKENEIIACARFYEYPGKVLTLRSLWVSPDHRGEKLGLMLLRRMLKTVKKGKVYLHCKEALGEYYGEIGFRYVIKPPKPLQEKMDAFHKEHPEAEPTSIFLWEALQHKVDPSFSARPDLLVIDGGKGQLSTIVEVLKELNLDIPVIGLAKREEEVFVPNRSDPILFEKDSPGKFLLMRLRDEAHRFANLKREGRGLADAKRSALDNVPGIGPETRKALMLKFMTLTGIKKAPDSELLKILTQGQLEQVRKHL